MKFSEIITTEDREAVEQGRVEIIVTRLRFVQVLDSMIARLQSWRDDQQ